MDPLVISNRSLVVCGPPFNNCSIWVPSTENTLKNSPIPLTHTDFQNQSIYLYSHTVASFYENYSFIYLSAISKSKSGISKSDYLNILQFVQTRVCAVTHNKNQGLFLFFNFYFNQIEGVKMLIPGSIKKL